MKDVSHSKIHESEKEENFLVPNAVLFERSRYLKKGERDPRMVLSSQFEDFIVSKSYPDLIEKLKKTHVYREVYDRTCDESEKIQELTSIQSRKEGELSRNVEELLKMCMNRGIEVSHAESYPDLEVKKAYLRSNELRDEISGLKKQIQHLRMHDKSEEKWPDPSPLKKDLLPVPQFDVLLMPEPMRLYAQGIAEELQCPVDYLAVGLFVSFSAIIGAGCVIRPLQFGDWTVIPNLWGAIIGPPSIKKTPALNAAMVPLAALEKEADKEFEKKKLRAEVDKVEVDARKKIAKAKIDEAIKNENENEIEAIKEAFLHLESEGKQIQCKRYKTNDCTIEKLGELLSDNPRGLLVFRDEIMGFLVSLEKDGREDSRAFYIEAWTGYSSSPIKSDRIKRGTVSCNPCISVLGGIQPSKLRLYLQESLSSIGNDGLIQRFQLLVFPDRANKWDLVDRKSDVDARDRLIAIAGILANTDFFTLGALSEGDFPLPVFRFSNEAQQFFINWLSDLERGFLEESDDGLLTEHLAKYRSLMPSLALVIYLVDIALEGSSGSGVDLESARKAASICTYLEAHARRVYSSIEGSSIHAAKQLLKKIKDGLVTNPFTQRQVYRKEWSGLSSQKNVEEACSELVASGWLREEIVPPSAKGGPVSARYILHPCLRKMLVKGADKTDKTSE